MCMVAALIHQESCRRERIVTDYATGEVGCGSCGAVSDERIEAWDGAEMRPGTGGRTTMKMADMGLYTLIESRDMDAAGRHLSGENRRMFHRLRMWDRNSRSAASAKSFQRAFVLLDGLASKLAMPEPVVEQTAQLFRRVAAKKMLAGRSTAGMLCAAAYATCRMTGTPRTLQDVADAGNITRKSLQRTYRHLMRVMGMRPEAYDPSGFVARVAAAAGIPERTERLAFRILEHAARSGASVSKNPVAMAAASVHLAAVANGDPVSQALISQASGISAVTIRDRAREIRGMAGGVPRG